MQVNAQDRTSSNILFSWLLLLRWGASASQVVLIAAVALFFDIEIPAAILAAIISFQLISNLYFTFLKKHKSGIPEWLFITIMFLDTGLLTLLLYVTGGPMNPFTFIYLVHVVVGALLMKPAWTWTLAVFTILCYALLFFLPGAEHINALSAVSDGQQAICLSMLEASNKAEEHMKLHLLGMWFAFAITTLLIVFFVGRIQKDLVDHQHTLADLEAAKLRNEKLASLATLAAGAAHEFSTPLSTIAVASGEMLHFLKKQKNPDLEALLEDTNLIRDQVQRCKDILFHMAADAGEHLGEAVQDFTVQELIENVMHTFSSADQQKIDINNKIGKKCVLTMPERMLTRIIRGLLKNSLDASVNDKNIQFDTWVDNFYLFFQITDHGIGMDAGVAAKAAEPFFTTKDPGKGLGLGLFLAKTAAERFGGKIHIQSEPDRGSIVTLSLALDKVLKKNAAPKINQ